MPADHRLALVLERERETKTKVRYDPADGQPAVGAIYLDKETAAALGTPKRLTVTLAAEEAAPLSPAA
ncbi:MAG: hypothetical protein ACR2J6_05370 [Thermoleophilaceae bacterium]